MADETQMTEKTEEKLLRQKKIREALDEPPVPKGLVERTVLRGKAIETGRAAEEKLAAGGDRLPREEKAGLLADAVLGRLMLTAKPPEGADLALMRTQLLAEPRFTGFASLPTEKCLSDLRAGRLIGQLAPSREKSPGAPSKEAPVKEQPIIETPSKNSPTL